MVPRVVIVANSSKQVPKLGNIPVPVEVALAEPFVKRRIEALGALVTVRQSNGRPFVTDEGHQIRDCRFGQIPDATALARKLSDMPGVMEHGLFINVASIVLVARGLAEVVREFFTADNTSRRWKRRVRRNYSIPIGAARASGQPRRSAR
jgi:ribose 5-phosphate isomerase A